MRRVANLAPIRAAVVGAGLMGRWHADALLRAGGQLAWVVDVDRARAERLARRHPGARVAPDLDSALGQVDVVHVCTPLATHVQLARRALEAGCHVLIEKPLADTAAATAELLELAARQRRLLCPVHQFLFQPGARRALGLVDRIAPLLHIDAVACSAGAEVGPFADDPDALIPEIVPHALALLVRLLPGELPEVSWQAQHARPGEMRATARVGETSIGMIVSSAGRPTANSLRLIGARGSIEVDLFHGFAVFESGDVSRLRKIAHPFAHSGATLLAATTNLAQRVARLEPAYPGLRELIRQFYVAAQSPAPPPIAPSETLEVASARDALIGALGREPGNLNREPTVDPRPRSRPDRILLP